MLFFSPCPNLFLFTKSLWLASVTSILVITYAILERNRDHYNRSRKEHGIIIGAKASESQEFVRMPMTVFCPALPLPILLSAVNKPRWIQRQHVLCISKV